MHRLQDLGVPQELIWGIMALYETVVGRARTSEGLSQPVHPP